MNPKVKLKYLPKRDCLEINLDGEPIQFNSYTLEPGPFGEAMLALLLIASSGDEQAVAFIGGAPDDPDGPPPALPKEWWLDLSSRYSNMESVPVIGNAPMVRPVLSLLANTDYFDKGETQKDLADLSLAQSPDFRISGFRVVDGGRANHQAVQH